MRRSAGYERLDSTLAAAQSAQSRVVDSCQNGSFDAIRHHFARLPRLRASCAAAVHDVLRALNRCVQTAPMSHALIIAGRDSSIVLVMIGMRSPYIIAGSLTWIQPAARDRCNCCLGQRVRPNSRVRRTSALDAVASEAGQRLHCRMIASRCLLVRVLHARRRRCQSERSIRQRWRRWLCRDRCRASTADVQPAFEPIRNWLPRMLRAGNASTVATDCD